MKNARSVIASQVGMRYATRRATYGIAGSQGSCRQRDAIVADLQLRRLVVEAPHLAAGRDDSLDSGEWHHDRVPVDHDVHCLRDERLYLSLDRGGEGLVDQHVEGPSGGEHRLV